ncbi:MAG TPA: hypothetical protein VF765_02615 [Polyangiaceae bacterium]
MATRSEQYRSDAQRTGKPKRRSQKKPRKNAWSKDKAHAGSKATHALEAGGARESTRASANRAKADSAFNVTEETRKGAPQARARRVRAQGRRVRGSS